MNTDKIFNLFLNTSDQIEQPMSEETQRLVDDFKEHPLVKIGMFKKIIKNYMVLGDKILKVFMQSNVDLDVDDIKKAGEYMIYLRAWDNIKSININDEFHLENIKNVANQELIVILDNSIKYFKTIEAYEKCAHLFKIREKVKEFLKVN